jgi:hypothetical protein
VEGLVHEARTSAFGRWSWHLAERKALTLVSLRDLRIVGSSMNEESMIRRCTQIRDKAVMLFVFPFDWQQARL